MGALIQLKFNPCLLLGQSSACAAYIGGLKGAGLFFAISRLAGHPEIKFS